MIRFYHNFDWETIIKTIIPFNESLSVEQDVLCARISRALSLFFRLFFHRPGLMVDLLTTSLFPHRELPLECLHSAGKMRSVRRIIPDPSLRFIGGICTCTLTEKTCEERQIFCTRPGSVFFVRYTVKGTTTHWIMSRKISYLKCIVRLLLKKGEKHDLMSTRFSPDSCKAFLHFFRTLQCSEQLSKKQNRWVCIAIGLN